MQTYMIQIQLCQHFEDIYVKATSWDDAIEKAKAEVASNDDLSFFRHRFTNYVA